MNKLEDEIVKQTGEVYKESIENVALPISESIGNNLKKVTDGLLGWFGVWGEKQKLLQEKNLNEFRLKLEEDIKEIPKEKIVEPKSNIFLPAIDAAKFYYEEEYLQDLFANLIVNSFNKEALNDIHPAFIETIKQLSSLDAKVLKAFKYNNTYPIAGLQAIDSNNKVTPSTFLLFDFKNQNDNFDDLERANLTRSIDNLTRLGLIVKNQKILELNYDYNSFKEDILYKLFNESTGNDKKIEIIKYRLELTSYGRSFLKVCVK